MTYIIAPCNIAGWVQIQPTDMLVAILAVYWVRGRVARARVRRVLDANPTMKRALIAAGFDVDAEDIWMPLGLVGYAALRLK